MGPNIPIKTDLNQLAGNASIGSIHSNANSFVSFKKFGK